MTYKAVENIVGNTGRNGTRWLASYNDKSKAFDWIGQKLRTILIVWLIIEVVLGRNSEWPLSSELTGLDITQYHCGYSFCLNYIYIY